MVRLVSEFNVLSDYRRIEILKTSMNMPAIHNCYHNHDIKKRASRDELEERFATLA